MESPEHLPQLHQRILDALTNDTELSPIIDTEDYRYFTDNDKEYIFFPLRKKILPSEHRYLNNDKVKELIHNKIEKALSKINRSNAYTTIVLVSVNDVAICVTILYQQ